MLRQLITKTILSVTILLMSNFAFAWHYQQVENLTLDQQSILVHLHIRWGNQDYDRYTPTIANNGTKSFYRTVPGHVSTPPYETYCVKITNPASDTSSYYSIKLRTYNLDDATLVGISESKPLVGVPNYFIEFNTYLNHPIQLNLTHDCYNQ